ncbi:MAG: patatin-like phospholipase family protein [Planctomycetota bacterium]
MRISLALSGGGVRATVFHLGVLGRLARQDLLGNVKIISSVSGGSLAAGLIFGAANQQWPTSQDFLNHVVPHVHERLTTKDLQWAYARKALLCPWRLISGRATILGDELERQWGIEGYLGQLPESPSWLINATCFQTGKNWRFQRDLMGDYKTKYVLHPEFRLANALAASAAVPGLIGPLVIKSPRYRWFDLSEEPAAEFRPRYRRLHLWDGGVYDNLGVESLYKPGVGLCEGTDFLMVSDASRHLPGMPRHSWWNPGYLKATLRLVDVATDQVRSVRARTLMDYFRNHPGSGVYLRMGRDTSGTLRQHSPDADHRLTRAEINEVASMETTLRQLSHREFSLLFRHGFEVADVTLGTHGMERLADEPRSHVAFPAA